MLKIGTKVKMIKPIGKFDFVGTVFTISDIDNEMYEVTNEYGIGYMSMKECNEYFKVVEDIEIDNEEDYDDDYDEDDE